jgi:hypothetical protein
MALVGALCIAINAVAGFTNRSLRTQVAGLLFFGPLSWIERLSVCPVRAFP